MSRKLKPATTTALANLETHWAEIDAIREQAMADRCAIRPPNSVTTSEYAERYGIDRCTAGAQLSAFVTAGKLHTGTVRIANHIHRIYWPK